MSFARMLKPIGKENYVIILEDLEFAFEKKELEMIAGHHNYGFGINEIAEHMNRNEYEILLAILHLHRQGQIKRKIRIV